MKGRILFAAFVAAGLLALALAVLLREPPRSAVVAAEDRAQDDISRLEASSDAHDPDRARETGAGNGERSAIVALEEGLEAPDASHTEREFVSRLRSAIEMSLFQRLDPGAMLDAALGLAALDVDGRAVPTPNPAGEMRFPVLGTPEGVDARLTVTGDTGPTRTKVLGMDIELEAPLTPYLLEGVARKPPRVQFGVWSERDGEPYYFAIMASVAPSGAESRKLGIPWEESGAQWTLGYYLDLKNPENSKMTSTRFVNGTLQQEDIPLVLDGGEWPRMDKIHLLSELLSSHYVNILDGK